MRYIEKSIAASRNLTDLTNNNEFTLALIEHREKFIPVLNEIKKMHDNILESGNPKILRTIFNDNCLEPILTKILIKTDVIPLEAHNLAVIYQQGYSNSPLTQAVQELSPILFTKKLEFLSRGDKITSLWESSFENFVSQTPIENISEYEHLVDNLSLFFLQSNCTSLIPEFLTASTN
jgi:hypothetical protein